MSKTTTTAIVLAIVAVTCLLVRPSAAQTTHVVGGDLGWLEPASALVYQTWAATQTFKTGDILMFNFTTGKQDVARVTKEAFAACNSTSPIFLEKTGPFNYTLDSAGEYFFIGTMENHCALGQKLAINVTAAGATTFYVGDDLGWEVPPGGEVYYSNWADGKVFNVGDTLVFNFINGTQDVAVVTKEAYGACNTTAATAVLSISPARVTLAAIGEYFYTSNYTDHCNLGQKLAINVTGTASGSPGPSSPSPTAGGPVTAVSPSSATSPSAIFGISLVTLVSAIFLHVFY